jgi:xanthine/uracil permease
VEVADLLQWARQLPFAVRFVRREASVRTLLLALGLAFAVIGGTVAVSATIGAPAHADCTTPNC